MSGTAGGQDLTREQGLTDDQGLAEDRDLTVTADSVGTDAVGVDPADVGRQLFAYLGGPQWREYRAILGVFAGTFFAEFTPEDVTAALAERGEAMDPSIVGERLESLRR